MKIEIPQNIRTALELLEASGFEAYAVGGCVRDSLLGKTPYDWDVCTSALPQETQEVFCGFRTIPTGIKHGTVTVIIESPIEITTFRIDGEYIDNRRPSEVEFTRSLENDLCRRDFTVNAMVLSRCGKITDLYGGREDLDKKIIRCVGEAEKRFDEDALRIMRALRFAATLGFEIEKETAKAVLNKKELLKNIAVERIRTELDKLLLGSCADILVRFKEVFAVFMPQAEINEETAEKIEAAPEKLEMRLALLLASCGAETAAQILKSLKYSNSVYGAVVQLLENKDVQLSAQPPQVKRLLNKLGADGAKQLYSFAAANGSISAAEYDELTAAAEKILENGECFTLSALAVNGSDLSKLGIRNRQIGQTLHRLLELVMDGEENTKENLLNRAGEYVQWLG